MKRTIAAVALVLAILAVVFWGMAGWWQEKRELSALQSEYESARELQQALLEALKPFVSPAHQKRLARALQLAQLSKMAGLALQTLEQENDT